MAKSNNSVCSLIITSCDNGVVTFSFRASKDLIAWSKGVLSDGYGLFVFDGSRYEVPALSISSFPHFFKAKHVSGRTLSIAALKVLTSIKAKLAKVMPSYPEKGRYTIEDGQLVRVTYAVDETCPVW
jgi:hypothetical protein